MSDPDKSTGHDPSEQLARLQRLCRLRSIALYRTQALYLQIIRDELRSAARQALFNLLNDVDPSRITRLTDAGRGEFLAAVDALVNRCVVLLTVEQLMQLVDQMRREQVRHQAHASREMLRGLSDQMQEAVPSDAPPSPVQPASRHEPVGSIHLSLSSPLETSQVNRAASQPPPSPPADAQQPPVDQSQDAPTEGDLDVLKSLFQLAGEAIHASVESSGSESAADAGVSFAKSDASNGSGYLLPHQPDALLHWMEAMDLALQRRLRNLSHAINVQMLRSGLAQALLPINLLDAVLVGQIETQPAATNVLRLRLPLTMGDQEAGMDVFSLLIRSCDLEFDSHRLRRCRKHLREHHQALLRMVQQQRHWERRSLDREARTHWQNPPDPLQQGPGD